MIGVQALLYGAWHSPAVLFGSSVVVASLAGSILYAFTLADIDTLTPAQAWARALERAWATIVVNFG